MVDATIYQDAATTPERALRQLFVRAHLPSEWRLTVANAGYLDVGSFAILGDDLKTAKETLAIIFDVKLT